ncbi:MAG: hypothetical protein QNK23_11780 [Crocinitomicaceae bacterium]|nr:hypothetical protein [Crocinitomicaceae bacterium]
MKKLKFTLAILAITMCSTTFAQYNMSAGQNRVTRKAVRSQPALDASGSVILDNRGIEVYEEVEVDVPVAADEYGNAEGTQYDLATDGAFEGNTVAVLHLYTGEGFDFAEPKAALEQKGFSVFRWIDNPPSPEELRESLKNACQLWVISSHVRKLTDEHAEVIKEFFESGKGLYIWGDNEPFYADANFLTQKLFGTTMNGNLEAGQTVGVSGEASNRAGIVDGHLISTGVANMYEGITIATVKPTQELSALVYGSADNMVTAIYEHDGKRAIIDGGFTRLYYAWDTAGTGRYVKNAAAWLVNYERFGELVYDEQDTDDLIDDLIDNGL